MKENLSIESKLRSCLDNGVILVDDGSLFELLTNDEEGIQLTVADLKEISELLDAYIQRDLEGW